jgi:hypothetical protein
MSGGLKGQIADSPLFACVVIGNDNPLRNGLPNAILKEMHPEYESKGECDLT